MTSFEFTWNNSNKPTGKAFARKRPSAGTKTPMTVKPDHEKVEASKPSKKPPELEISVASPPKSPHLVRRKQKKDKIVAKNKSLEESDEVEGAKRGQRGANKPPQASHSLFAVRHKEVYVNSDVRGKSVVEKVFGEGTKFCDLEIHRHLVANLVKSGFEKLTKVQEKAIPEIMGGKNILIRSQTGSGKTLAYAVPIVDALQNLTPRLQRQEGLQALIVVPTRELALQTHELFAKINTFQWIVAGHLCGGENRKTEKDRLRKGLHVLIATPGRLLDHLLHTAAFKIDKVRCLVLDEADRLLDMGFKKDIVRLVEALDAAKTNPEYDPLSLLTGKKPKVQSDEDTNMPPLKNRASSKRQTVLLSATLNESISELADFAMKDHVYIDALDDAPNLNSGFLVVPPTVKQEFVVTYAKHRLFTLAAVLMTMERRKVFVFMATTQMVNYHHALFSKYLTRLPKNSGKFKVEEGDEGDMIFDGRFFKLHGNMDQGERKTVFREFRAANSGIMLCTDVAARGIDVPEADCIIQYTGPQSDEDYVHRVGRTGRAGKSGTALIFLTHEEQEYIARLQKYKVFLKKREPEEFLHHLSIVMEEPNHSEAAAALQRRFESALTSDGELHRLACFAFSSWFRFYNTYPAQMKTIFNFKNANLGHYVTSFGLKETPTVINGIVRGHAGKIQPKRLNQKLTIHSDEGQVKPQPKRKIKSISLTTSEYGSGLESSKKKKKKNPEPPKKKRKKKQ